MGKAYRKHALDILTLLKEMQGKIQKEARRKNRKIAGQLLAEAQEAAIALGNSIEAYLGEGSNTVQAIEEYCEVIYRLHTSLQEKSGFDSILSELYSQWKQIWNFAQEELPNRYEMVFLPYKVSMWDSLESVWRAAEEDPDCDAYVMPVPYYDKNPDGTFRSEHYEGEEFPEDVPVTHYLEYDLEKRHPDVVFIHNPYDDRNFVTSVHPYFYSANLKKYAEKLVYIPYYISAEINPDSREAMEGKAGMALTNGVLNADMVFLQSENTKKLFVNILSEYIPEVKRSYWENKIWGLGSPKLDRVNRVVRDDARLPKDWHDLIYTESGLRKKVIFYNISISTLLKNPDMLNKIRDVLQFFKNCKEAALWWRPHPLYESTLASMRPDMLSEYQQMVNQYRQEGWGIFDDGVDLQWAIAETDAYYGDRSSVVQLFREARKPVMIQDVTVRTQREIKAEDIPIWPSAFCVDEDDVWFVHGKMNALMRYNMIENYTYIIGTIPNEEMFQESLYKGIYKWRTKIFLIPCWAREIAVYDILNRTFTKIALKETEAYVNKTLFQKIYVRDGCLYCIPYYYKAYLKIDMYSLNIEYFDISKEIEAQGISMSNVCLNDSTVVGDEIISVLAYSNVILCYQMQTDMVSVKRLGLMKHKFTNITNLGQMLYLFDWEAHSIIKIQKEDYSVEEEICVLPYGGIKIRGINSEFLLIDPIDDESIQVIDAEGKPVFKFDERKDVCMNSMASTFHCGVERSNCAQSEFSYYYNVSAGLFYQFDKGKLKRQFPITLGNNECSKWRDEYLDLINMETKENDIYNLDVWINNLRGMKTVKNKQQQSNGEKILYAILKRL